MHELELESRMGRFRAEYTPAFGKIFINAIFALIWLFLGYSLVSMLWGFYNSRGAAMAAGLVFLATGLGYVVVPFWRRFGRKARLYEEGVWISIRGREQNWRFDEIEGIRVIPGRSSTMGYRVVLGTSFSEEQLIRGLVADILGERFEAAEWVQRLLRVGVGGYQFYVGGEPVFEVRPVYKRWKELGAEVFLAVMTAVISRTVELVKRGEPVVYDDVTAGKAIPILVAAEVMEQLARKARFGAT